LSRIGKFFKSDTGKILQNVFTRKADWVSGGKTRKIGPSRKSSSQQRCVDKQREHVSKLSAAIKKWKQGKLFKPGCRGVLQRKMQGVAFEELLATDLPQENVRERVEQLEILSKQLSVPGKRLIAGKELFLSDVRAKINGEDQSSVLPVQKYLQQVIACADGVKDDTELFRRLEQVFSAFVSSNWVRGVLREHNSLTSPLLHAEQCILEMLKEQKDLKGMARLHASVKAAVHGQAEHEESPIAEKLETLEALSLLAVDEALVDLFRSCVRDSIGFVKTSEQLVQLRKTAFEIAKKSGDLSVVEDVVREFSRLREHVSLDRAYPVATAERIQEIFEGGEQGVRVVEGVKYDLRVHHEGGGARKFEIISFLGKGAAKSFEEKVGGDLVYDAAGRVSLLVDHMYAEARDATGGSILREEAENIAICQQYDIPNIVDMYGFSCDGQSEVMYVELCREGDGSSFTGMDYDKGALLQRLRVCKDASQALSAMHEHQLCHSDVKPGNIFISGQGGKLADFDGMKKFGEERVAFTDRYLDFEGRQKGGKTLCAENDVFAMAITLFEFLGGENPFVEASSEKGFKEQFTEQTWAVKEVEFKGMCEELKGKITPLIGEHDAGVVIESILSGVKRRAERGTAQDMVNALEGILERV